VLTQNPEEAARHIRALLGELGVSLTSIEVIMPTLEDAFIASVRGRDPTR